MIAVADASPVCYLILIHIPIHEIDVFPERTSGGAASSRANY
jgi:hypothetical protein